MIYSVIMILLALILVIAILEWLLPMASVPGKIIKIIEAIVIIIGVFKLLAALGFNLF